MENRITLEDFEKLLSTMNEEEKREMLNFWAKKHSEYELNHIALFKWELELITDIGLHFRILNLRNYALKKDV